MKEILDIIREDPKQFMLDALAITGILVELLVLYILLYALGF